MTQRRKLANAIRMLSIDAVQAANSGHPGMPMGMADIAEVLWNDFLKHNPKDPSWFNRDRFVLSNGHGSMLIYSLLHLSGYDLPIQELKDFRKLHSKTPGHPEYGLTPGVETTTGPLGQGIANAVGLAMAEKHLAATFNRDGHEVVDHHTYCFVGDGCLMEGISHEACSLAGTLGLEKLIVFYDDNGISIDGDVTGWFTDNTPQRFESYGWNVIPQVDGHDADAIRQAIAAAREQHKPTLICCQTQIGWGSPSLAGTAKTHGAPLGDEEIKLVREKLEWPHAPFEIPADVQQAWDASENGKQHQDTWQQQFDAYKAENPELAAEFERRMKGEFPQDWDASCQQWLQEIQAEQKPNATRKSSQQAINYFAPKLPELMGGSADLTGSNNTNWKEAEVFAGEHAQGRYVEYGVREFGMSAIANGLALHGGVIPFTGTFLTFSDYARNAVRLAALMKIKNIFVYTHDSIGLGEDGPTHQAVEHASSLRLIPNLNVWRPCDTLETAVAWQQSINYQGPSCLLLTRQTIDAHQRTAEQLQNVAKGGYVLVDCEGTPDVILMATGSEVELAVNAAKQLTEQGENVRVVSMPCVDVFETQPQAYQEAVLPKSVARRIAIEAGSTATWYKYVGTHGHVVGLDTFGESAPCKDVYAHFNITVEEIVKRARVTEGAA